MIYCEMFLVLLLFLLRAAAALSERRDRRATIPDGALTGTAGLGLSPQGLVTSDTQSKRFLTIAVIGQYYFTFYSVPSSCYQERNQEIVLLKLFEMRSEIG